MYYTSLPELKRIERRNQATRRDAFILLFRRVLFGRGEKTAHTEANANPKKRLTVCTQQTREKE